jgi:hypothetical protein
VPQKAAQIWALQAAEKALKGAASAVPQTSAHDLGFTGRGKCGIGQNGADIGDTKAS